MNEDRGTGKDTSLNQENPRSNEADVKSVPDYDRVDSNGSVLFAGPTDAQLRHIGLNDKQIYTLAGHDGYTRQAVYDEQIRLLMEREAGYDDLADDLNL